MGTLEKIYILHGWTTSVGKWDPLLDLLKQAKLNPILLKIPGLTQKTNKVWDLEDYIGWLHEKLKKDKEIILIGHSSGGRMALAYVNRYPEKIKKLVLIDSAGIYNNNLSLKLKRFLFKNLALLGKKITSSENLRNLLYKLAREKDYNQATPLQKQIMRKLISVDLTNILGKIKTPTIIIWGKGDKSTPLANGRLMHRMIKNSKIYVIAGARHSPQFTHPKIVVDKILKEILK